MSSATLTRHDAGILSKINDPESAPTSGLLISDALPRDPHVPADQYPEVARRERDILRAVQQAEAGSSSASTDGLVAAYAACVCALTDLIHDHPTYASARNNRAQALRRLYGDHTLLALRVEHSPPPPAAADPAARPLIAAPAISTITSAATAVLVDLNAAIRLLTPAAPFAPLSAPAARTLASAHTQRGAVLLAAAQACAGADDAAVGWLRVQLDGERRGGGLGVEVRRLDLEQLAAQDFARGGRYGNEIARNLAVATNPTAKLCGDMVREAMRKEMMGEI